MQRLASIRGKESRYLRPLMKKMEGLMGYELSNQTLPLPIEMTAGYPLISSDLLSTSPRRSLVDSVGMLRTLSMSGNLGMPMLSAPLEDWQQRRPSGRVLDEYETKTIEHWMMSDQHA